MKGEVKPFLFRKTNKMKLHYNQVSKSILEVKVDKRNECFNFGADNAYPSLIRALVEMSITAKTCVDRAAKAIYGGSFGELGEVVVNSSGETLNEVFRIAAREYAEYNNVYLAVGYNLAYEVKSISVIPATDPRIGKDDDRGYSGKFIIYDNWDKTKGKKIQSSKFVPVDRFSRNKEILVKQIEKAGDITKYNGQLLHIKKDTAYIYSLSDLHPVLGEALLEANSQTFRSRGAEKGFLNTKLLATQPFKDDDTRKEFQKDLNGVRGAENSSEVVLLESAQAMDDLSKQIYLDDLSSKYNDKLFSYSDEQAEKNICKAFTVPLVLVNPSDSSMFGNSGEVLKEAKKQLYEGRKEDRDQLEEAFSYLMSRFTDPVTDLEVINPYEEKVDELIEDTPEALNLKAQATLRGSVGGVTALLAIQQSVSEGTTDKEAGVAMIMNIYGYDEETATAMLGDPKPTE